MTPPPLRIAAVLLAAGSASRMGHRPKCLLEWDGQSLLQRQLSALGACGVSQLVLVLGHHGARIAQAAQGFTVKPVHNPDPQADQNASLRLGLQALSEPLDAALVALADQALITAQDIQDLIAAYAARPSACQVVQPSVEGLPGNPVIFSAAVRRDILASPDGTGCKQWQAAHPEQVYRWVSANSHYRADVDTPEDLRALQESSGIRLQWPADLA
jgi:molybdenum cofactor cytidylyltransferase